MEDKRITKTKGNLKQALIKSLPQKPFEQITVTELCAASGTSRVTFYSHYADKYELVDDILKDMMILAEDDFQHLQLLNNPNMDHIIGFTNLFDSILNMYYAQESFFCHTNQNENPYLYFAFYQYILKSIEIHAKKVSNRLILKYSLRQISGFLCNGLWGFITESQGEHFPREIVRAQIKELIGDILTSGILIEKN